MRRTFFDVKLYDWVVRHDLLGEGSLMKTIYQRGAGFDRPTQFDEMNLDVKVY